MSNKCIKTGCNIAFSDSPDNVYRGDAHLIEGIVIFKVRTPSYLPGTPVDFLIDSAANHIEITDVIAVKSNNVAVQSKGLIEMWTRYYDDDLLNSWLNSPLKA